MLRKFSAFLLCACLLLGCIGLGAWAADANEPTRVVRTPFGIHWYTGDDVPSEITVGGKSYTGTSAKFQGAWAHSAFDGDFNTDPGRGKPMRFIVTGDLQASDAAGFAYSAAVVEAAWDKFPDSDFYVTLGDFTNSSNNEQWDMYFEAFKNVNAKRTLVPIAGNHDGNFKWNWFRNMFALPEQPNLTNVTGVYYSFDYGDAHIAVLNTNDMYPMSMAQQNWFVNDMKASDAKWKLVFMHRAPYSAGNDANLPDNLIMRRVLIPLFDRAGVDLVMYGHDHQYVRTVPMYGDKPVDENSEWLAYVGYNYPPAGTVYILPGAAATKRYALRTNLLPAVKNAFAKNEEPGVPMFAGLSIDGGTLTYAAYTYDPATKAAAPYDSLTLTKTTFAGADPDFKPLPTDMLLTLPQQIMCLFTNVFNVIVIDYLFTLLPGMFG